MENKNTVDLSNTILNITSYMAVFSLICNIGLDLYFNNTINTKTIIPIILLLIFCTYKKNQ